VILVEYFTFQSAKEAFDYRIIQAISFSRQALHLLASFDNIYADNATPVLCEAWVSTSRIIVDRLSLAYLLLTAEQVFEPFGRRLFPHYKDPTPVRDRAFLL
jgi:hypothetical protein